MTPQQAITDEDIQRCYSAMAALRPHIRREDFLPLVRQMYDEGYGLVYIASEEEVVAVAGYRISTNLQMGKNLYVDDLSTIESNQSKGYGKCLVEWLESEAARIGCNIVRLDSGVQRARAHKFYFRQGYVIAAFHFLKSRSAP